LKELNESRVWLEMIQQKKLVSEDDIRPGLEECLALSMIIAVSRRTAAQNAGNLTEFYRWGIGNDPIDPASQRDEVVRLT
jgi:hypothetical protein